MKKTALYILLGLLCSCVSKNPITELKTGNWLFEFEISETDANLTIPFNVEVTNAEQLIIKNAGERIEVSEISYIEDSVFIKIPVFGSELKGKMSGDKITGLYYNYNREKTSTIPFSANYGIEDRFETTATPAVDFSGKWLAHFGSDEKSSPTIGIFKQEGNKVTGTFQTETGDYRYLEGIVNGNSMQLSCFDGAHIFLFTAENKDGKLSGKFYSGNTWRQTWTAEKTENAELSDMKSLTWLKPGYDKLAFSFPNEKGETISLDDPKFKDKVVIAQIFGTWCPNCMDETRYFVDLYKNYNSEGLEIIGLDFETQTDFDYFKKRVARFRNDLNVPYELVLAGSANKKLAAEALPMLNKVISFPTAIFIDRKGNVREIHTGFSGPGTGNEYEHYKKETEELLEKLLQE